LKPMRGRWDGVLTAWIAVGFTAMGGCFGVAAQERPRIPFACGGETVARGSADRVIDGRTFVLEDGREIRLAGIEVAEPGPAGTAAADALAAQLAGAEVVLKQAEAQRTDRYGWIRAYAFTARDGVEHSVQAELIGAGFARVAAQAGNRACATELLSREAAARQAKLGLWASSYYDLLDAENPAAVLAEQGHFALVEGKVVSVRESGATIYVNFGRRWTEDFTVTILKRNQRSFTAAGLEPMKLAGRRIRVRGWIEERGGPWIEAVRPEQIEFADGEGSIRDTAVEQVRR
jgi:endonuclease YncB( thermonuclease family)